MEVPEVEMEVEDFSHKVPLETRTDAFHALRKSLHRVFPPGVSSRVPQRATLLLAEAAKTLEHEVLNMCATPSGYGERIVQKRRAIVSLVVDEDEARRRACEKKGAGEEDVGEVIKALRGGVALWQKMYNGTRSAVA
ncbi:hypothetical protein OG21DRAFT_1487942 [Imleria badia]|nr:hypothetical protein OG21DRAFT_1487942 [Imleria badia]